MKQLSDVPRKRVVYYCFPFSSRRINNQELKKFRKKFRKGCGAELRPSVPYVTLTTRFTAVQLRQKYATFTPLALFAREIIIPMHIVRLHKFSRSTICNHVDWRNTYWELRRGESAIRCCRRH